MAEAVTAVEELVAFKAAGMDLSAKLQEASANRINVGDPILLFAFDAVACNVLLELAGQILFEFARTHGKDWFQLAIAQKVVKRPIGRLLAKAFGVERLPRRNLVKAG
jgi:hypothetical protein